MTIPPRISLSGTSYEIGFNHGKSLKIQIARQIEIYYDMFNSNSKFDREGVNQRALEYEATIRTSVPHIHQEMVGIAEGAGVSIVDIVALNVRSEIALGEFHDGCTSISWKIECEGGETTQYLAQNWDWVRPVQENLAFVEIKQDGKPAIKMITEAGIVGKIGYNSASVGVLLNALRSTPTDHSKLPIHIILRLCLESSSVTEAIAVIEKHGIASAQHILIADTNGALGLELSPIQNHYMRPSENGFLAHTNHPVENVFIKESVPFDGSKERLLRTHQLAKTIPIDMVDAEKFRNTIFCDKVDGEYAICASEIPSKPKWTRTMTLFNIVMRFREGEEPSAEFVFCGDTDNWIAGGNLLRL
ncbi:hypothetical protein ABW20_dc0110634 [Dactylellina cionopaga]|nr:hypothetical protein ABW20_dc0110634 [Dactylellina cionopaga]